MIERIRIENFKNFEEFEFDGFKRVNLIAGKNNVGKTNLLEAMYLAENEFRPIGFSSLFQLRTNNPDFRKVKTHLQELNFYAESFIRQSFKQDSSFKPFFCQILINKEKAFTIEFKNYEEKVETKGLESPKTVIYPIENSKYDPANPRHCYKISGPTLIYYKYVGGVQNELFQVYLRPLSIMIAPDYSPIDFLSSSLEAIKETGKFPELIKVLSQVLELDIVDIYPFKQDFSELQELKFKISGTQNYQSFSSLGFGSNRISFYLITLFFSQNKKLFIDEIDLGFHYSKHETIWQIIFDLARLLNVQIFATTHSRDCIEAFAKVSKKFKNEGQYIRLQEKGGKIIAVDYSEEELESAVEFNSELR